MDGGGRAPESPSQCRLRCLRNGFQFGLVVLGTAGGGHSTRGAPWNLAFHSARWRKLSLDPEPRPAAWRPDHPGAKGEAFAPPSQDEAQSRPLSARSPHCRLS